MRLFVQNCTYIFTMYIYFFIYLPILDRNTKGNLSRYPSLLELIIISSSNIIFLPYNPWSQYIFSYNLLMDLSIYLGRRHCQHSEGDQRPRRGRDQVQDGAGRQAASWWVVIESTIIVCTHLEPDSSDVNFFVDFLLHTLRFIKKIYLERTTEEMGTWITPQTLPLTSSQLSQLPYFLDYNK